MAYHFDDCYTYRYNLRVYEFPYRLFGETLYGFIGSGISANSDSYKGEQEFFDPESADLDQEVTIIVNGAQESFSTTNCA